MNISFDLDDTLIPGNYSFEMEPLTLMQRIFRTERLRFGTVQLMKELKSNGHKVCIYTTSYRSVFSIRWLFLLNGIQLDGIYNKTKHDSAIRSLGFSCSSILFLHKPLHKHLLFPITDPQYINPFR
jgi:hypothetical protein